MRVRAHAPGAEETGGTLVLGVAGLEKGAYRRRIKLSLVPLVYGQDRPRHLPVGHLLCQGLPPPDVLASCGGAIEHQLCALVKLCLFVQRVDGRLQGVVVAMQVLPEALRQFRQLFRHDLDQLMLHALCDFTIPLFVEFLLPALELRLVPPDGVADLGLEAGARGDAGHQRLELAVASLHVPQSSLVDALIHHLTVLLQRLVPRNVGLCPLPRLLLGLRQHLPVSRRRRLHLEGHGQQGAAGAERVLRQGHALGPTRGRRHAQQHAAPRRERHAAEAHAGAAARRERAQRGRSAGAPRSLLHDF
mmetsp:Transcript_58262/g.165402  ORF Transcript_58262/g.165402 Transcript_58262/m.165402 type:complete len:304 (+) Transcript_58262:387-1298(+)